MFVAVMAFFARISDPAVGGTYMTLLNTVCNLGGNWPSTVMLWLVDVLTWRRCVSADGSELEHNTCANQEETDVSNFRLKIVMHIEMLNYIQFAELHRWRRHMQNRDRRILLGSGDLFGVRNHLVPVG